jgi:hypothetical protein
MTVSIEQYPNTVSFDAPAHGRTVRLARLSEAASAVAAERPERSDESGTSHLSIGEMAFQRQPVRPVRSFPLRSRSWLGVSLVAAVVALALVAFIAVDRVLPIPTASRPPASDRTVDLTVDLPSTPARLAAGSTRGIETDVPPPGSRGMSAEPAPSGVTLQGRGHGAMALLTGLAPGRTLSTGSDVGAGGWQFPASDVVLSNTVITPPTNFIGVDLLAELQLADGTIARRWPVYADWAAATPPLAVPTPAVEAERLAFTPPAPPMPPEHQSASEEIALLVKRGKGFIDNGDPAGARVMLRRAAESRNAEAALMLGATYDPVVLRELKVYGVAADIAMARTWYEEAKKLGSEEASRLLGILASAAR